MMVKKAILAAGGFLLFLILLLAACGSMYKVDESEYALALRFGEIDAVQYAPGLFFKAPFIDSVQRIDKRTLRADIPPREVPDQDKERLIIDTVIRYRVTDPVQFRKTLRDEQTALARLVDITYSALRDTIGQHDRTEIIGARPLTDETGSPIYDEEGLARYQGLEQSRAEVSREIQERIANAATEQNFGIEIITANIKRADFPPSVEGSIIDRLTEERKRVAASHRAHGEEEYRRRTASVDREAAVLISDAERDARGIRGEGEAEAIRIIRESLLLDPAFYEFQRTLETYRKMLGNDRTATVITTLDSPESFLRFLLGFQDPQPTDQDAPAAQFEDEDEN